jgi:uncharacterized protein (DUF1800 family)
MKASLVAVLLLTSVAVAKPKPKSKPKPKAKPVVVSLTAIGVSATVDTATTVRPNGKPDEVSSYIIRLPEAVDDMESMLVTLKPRASGFTGASVAKMAESLGGTEVTSKELADGHVVTFMDHERYSLDGERTIAGKAYACAGFTESKALLARMVAVCESLVASPTK